MVMVILALIFEARRISVLQSDLRNEAGFGKSGKIPVNGIKTDGRLPFDDILVDLLSRKRGLGLNKNTQYLGTLRSKPQSKISDPLERMIQLLLAHRYQIALKPDTDEPFLSGRRRPA